MKWFLGVYAVLLLSIGLTCICAPRTVQSWIVRVSADYLVQRESIGTYVRSERYVSMIRWVGLVALGMFGTLAFAFGKR